jgi:pimeloyl-ACP methyl ester carboxylesterase
MQISANGISLEVDDRGPAGGEPLVMIMGLGMQLVAWPEGLVDQLVAKGFRVIRFDNRDVGLSQRFDHLGVPNIAAGAVKHTLGMAVASPYRLADLADDTAALIDALGLQSAHVCGASMGGMVAQHLAAAIRSACAA